MRPDVQGNGGADADMTHEDPFVPLEPVDVVDVHVNRAVKVQERPMQDKPASVWDRISLNERSRQDSFDAEGEFAEEVVLVENRGKWKKNAAAIHRAGSGKGRGGREPKFEPPAQHPGRKVGVNGHLLGDALRRVKSEQMLHQDSEFRRNGLHPKPQVGQRLGNNFSQVNGEAEEDEQPVNEVGH